MTLPFSVVVAVDNRWGIGKNGKIPWHLSADLKYFKTLTTKTTFPDKKNLVVMGRRTWESLPKSYQPLPGRINCILSRKADLSIPSGVVTAQSFDEVLSLAANWKDPAVDQIFVIGGGQVYEAAVKHPLCQKIYLTKIFQDYQCDAFFPEDLDQFQVTHQRPALIDSGIKYAFLEYERKR
jgi:dihydrofolate reductase / thymidylate synthase